MSTERRGRRNFSPWAQWQLRLDADRARATRCPTEVRADVLGVAGPVPGAARRPARRRRRHRVPLDVEVAESVDCGTYRRERVVFDAEADDERARLPPRAPRPRARRARRSSRCTGTVPARPRCAGSTTPRVAAAIAGAPRRLRAPARRARATSSSRPTCAASASGADWAPPDKYLCDAQPRARVRRRRATRSPRTSGTSRARSTCSSEHPLVDPDAHRRGRLLLRRDHDVVPRRVGRRGCGRRVVSGYFSSWKAAHRVPWNLCGSQVLPGCSASSSTSTSARCRAAPAARRERDRRLRSSRSRPRPRRVARARDVSTTMLDAPADALEHHVVRRRAPLGRRARLRFLDAGSCRPGGVRSVGRRPHRRPSDRARASCCPGPYPPHDPLDAVVSTAASRRTSGQLPRDHDGVIVHHGPARRRA